MRNTRLRILVAVVGLSMLLLGLSCVRTATTDAGARGAGAPAASAPAASAPDGGLQLCEGVYALCTEASCFNNNGGVKCVGCKVRTGESVGQMACSRVPDAGPTPGEMIWSRYYPPHSMAVCQNPPHNQPWAACLDSRCYVDALDPTIANCDCVSSVNIGSAGEGNWIADTDLPKPQSCDGSFVSSANFPGANEVTCFLYRKNPKLYPPPILDGGSWDCGTQ